MNTHAENFDNWNRLDQVIRHLDLNVNSFAKEIGLKRAERLYQIKKGNYAISKNLASMIVSQYPNINESWLLTGEGSMLKTGEQEGRKIPLLNVSLDELTTDITRMPVSNELEIPILASSEFALVQRGDSMSPEITHGSIVFLKQADTDAVIFGDIYLVLSEKFNVIRFIRGADGGHWRLVAKNTEEYDDIVLEKSSVKAIYKVKGVLSMVSM